MDHNSEKRTIFVSLVVMLLLIALFVDYVLDTQQERWRKQHDGLTAVLPSPVPYPRWGPTESQAYLMELFQSNGDCRFPCWWGLVPGKTTWEEMHAFLSPFMDTYTEQHQADDGTVSTYLYYGAAPVNIEGRAYEDNLVSNLLIEDVHLYYISELNLSSIFQTYGMPDEIYIRSPHMEIYNCQGEFELFLYYPADHFAVRYRYSSYPINRPIRVCDLDQPDLTGFYLWDPALDYASFDEVMRSVSWHPYEKIVPLEEATSWTPESFYQVYRSQQGPLGCIEAPAYDWSNSPGIPPGQIPFSHCG